MTLIAISMWATFGTGFAAAGVSHLRQARRNRRLIASLLEEGQS